MAGKPWSEERRAAHAAKQAERKAAGPAPASKRTPKKDPNALAVEQMYGVGTVVLMGLGRFNEAFLADALTLELQAEPTGLAFAEVAKINPAFGDLLAKTAPASPYLLLGTVMMQTGLQIAANHGAKLGMLAAQTIPRDTLVIEMRGRMQAMAQHAEAERLRAEAEAREMMAEADAVQAILDHERAVKENEATRREADRLDLSDAERAEFFERAEAEDAVI